MALLNWVAARFCAESGCGPAASEWTRPGHAAAHPYPYPYPACHGGEDGQPPARAPRQLGGDDPRRLGAPREDEGEDAPAIARRRQPRRGPGEVGRIEIVPVLDAALAEEVSQTRQAREQADRLRADATTLTRQTAQRLRAQGMAQRDISVLLGVSHQAVSQLLAS